MSHLNIHSRPLYVDERSDKNRVGRPRVRFRKTTWYKKNLKKKEWNAVKPTVFSRGVQDEKKWLEVMTQYSDAFQDIAQSFIAGYYRRETYVPSSWAGKIIYEKVLDISKSKTYTMSRDVELCDVENRLRYVWFQAVVRYFQRKPSVPFRNYLFRMSLFELQSWVRRIKPIGLPYCVDNVYTMEPKATVLKNLTASNMNTYSKILLYNKYTGLSNYRISKKFGYTNNKISSDAKNLLHLVTDIT